MSGSNFFDFRQTLSTPSTKVRASTDAAPFTVTELTGRIDQLIRSGLPASLKVQGEVSQPKYQHGSGHLYFTLKDDGACIDAVMWKGDVDRLKFRVESGQEMVAGGHVKVYAERGKYQLYANRLTPVGTGPLELAFKQMRERLEKEGLFAAERKRPLPLYPRRIALVTSRSTAALQDILKVLRRLPYLELCLYHVPVQGDGAAARIAAAIRHISDGHRRIGGCDVLLLARGGGSLEDLWCFNEECVARAVAESSLVVITGIGHETDVSIADLVADYHAHTPTEAASVLAREWIKAEHALQRATQRLRTGLRMTVQDYRRQLAMIERARFFQEPGYRINELRVTVERAGQRLASAAADRLLVIERRMAEAARRLEARHPRHMAALATQRLSMAETRLHTAAARVLERRTQQVAALATHLHAVSPDAVLRRGFSITRKKKGGALVRSAGEVAPGERLLTQFGEGTLESVAEDPRQPRLFE